MILPPDRVSYLKQEYDIDESSECVHVSINEVR